MKSRSELNIKVPTSQDLAWAAELVATGWHGDEAEHESAVAAYSLLMWPGPDCPWFHPGPTPIPLDFDAKAWARCSSVDIDLNALWSPEYPEAL